MNDHALIFDAVRTPRGKGRPGGGLSQLSSVELLAQLFSALAERGAPLSELEDIYLGCVTQVGDQGANVAKVAALYAGLPDHVPGLTLNRLCTSGLDAAQLAAAQVVAGGMELMIAGGVESMSRVPIFSDKASWFADAEVSRRARFVQMGFAADVVATRYGLERGELDAYAARSHELAARAWAEGRFAGHVVAMRGEGGEVALAHDELVRAGTSVAQLSGLDPLFMDEVSVARARVAYPELGELAHVHHRGNSPSLADGAALLLMGSAAGGARLGLKARAKVRGWGVASVEPVSMLTGCVEASRRAAARAGVSLQDVGVYEINEAFAAPLLAAVRDLELDMERVNVNGGALAMGHAMGATGAMLLGELLGELERRDEVLGLVAVSGGAGLGSAMVIERV